MQFKGDGSTVFWYPGKKYVPKVRSENSKVEHEFACRSEDSIVLVFQSQKNKEKSKSATYNSEAPVKDAITNMSK